LEGRENVGVGADQTVRRSHRANGACRLGHPVDVVQRRFFGEHALARLAQQGGEPL
jgi:hypothetical protein